MTKVLSKMLTKQGVVVKGRHILDAMLVANRVVKEYKNDKAG